ncbi:MAG: glycosyltransferase family 4 protein [Vulcanimicrobiaceae bacterium]
MLAPGFPPRFNGVGDHAAKFARAVLEGGDGMLVLTEGESREFEGVAAQGVGSRWTVPAALRAVVCAARSRADAFYVQYTPFAYGARSLAPLLFSLGARINRLPLGVYVHEAFYPARSARAQSALKSFILAVRDTLVVSLAQRIFVASQERRAAILKRVPWKRPSNVIVAPFAANIEPPEGRRWAPGPRAASRKTLVAFGMVAPRRRLELIVDTIPVLVERGLDVELRIVGRILNMEYAQRLARYARAARVDDRIRWLENVDPVGVTQELLSSDAFLFASEYGMIPSSGVLLAGLAHGVPIVGVAAADDDPIFAPVVLSAQADATSLADAIDATLKDVESASARGARGSALYDERFSWRRLAADVCAELASVRK